MKKISKPLSIVMALLLVFAVFVTVFAGEEESETIGNETAEGTAGDSNDTAATAGAITIQLTIDNPAMQLNGQAINIDENGTTPILRDNRTLLPVRAVVEAMGGTVGWDGQSQTATLTLGDDTIRLTIDSATAYLNDNAETLDTVPILENNRTMLPIRFIAESFGYEVDWDSGSATVIISGGAGSTLTGSGTFALGSENAATVYMTTDISPEGLMAIYEALGRQAGGENVAVKISTGEPGGAHFLDPNLIKDLVQEVDGTIVESNTAYGGRRAGTALHRQVAEDHGFTAIANVDILDEPGTISLPVTGGTHLQEDIVGANFQNYDFHVVLSHFKGHAMGGFGGALKNMSIGYASPTGKNLIHSAGTSTTSFSGGTQDDFLESMAEAASAVVAAGGEENFIYISVMNHLSVDCDCDSNPADPTMADIGILASLDPVALDKACVDLVYAAADGSDLVERIESRNGIRTVEHAAAIGLGSLEYELVRIDD